MNKHLLVIGDKRCETCKQAEEEAEKISEERGIPLVKMPISALGVDSEIPLTCVIHKKAEKFTCFVGYNRETYAHKVESLLKET